MLDAYGALDICIDADLPLFIDPFLLFASDKEEYLDLHDHIVNHLIRLRDLAAENPNIQILGYSSFQR